MKDDLFTVKFDTNPSPWFNTYIEISFSKLKLQPVVDKLVDECSNKNFKSSYNYDPIVNKVIKESWDESCGSIRPYLKALNKMLLEQKQKDAGWDDGHVAAARSINCRIAWSTPGFVEARIYNDIYGG